MLGNRWKHAAFMAAAVVLLYLLGMLLAPWRPATDGTHASGLGTPVISALAVICAGWLGKRFTAGHRKERLAEIGAAMTAPPMPAPAGIRLRPELGHKALLALCTAVIVAAYVLFGLWSLHAAPPSVWLHGVAIGAAGAFVSGRPLLHGLMRMVRPTIVDVSRDGLLLAGARPVAIAWSDVDRIVVETGSGRLILRFLLLDIDSTLARMAPLDRRLVEAEWRSGHEPISINLTTLHGSVGAQLRAISRLMPPGFPGLDLRGPAAG